MELNNMKYFKLFESFLHVYKLAYLDGEYFLLASDGTPIGSTKKFDTLFILDKIDLLKKFPPNKDSWDVRIEWWLKDATGKQETLVNIKDELKDEYGNPLKTILDFYDDRMYVKLFTYDTPITAKQGVWVDLF